MRWVEIHIPTWMRALLWRMSSLANLLSAVFPRATAMLYFSLTVLRQHMEMVATRTTRMASLNMFRLRLMRQSLYRKRQRSILSASVQQMICAIPVITIVILVIILVVVGVLRMRRQRIFLLLANS